MENKEKRPASPRPELKHNNETLEVLKALGQISGNNHHGAIDKQYDKLDRGLRSDSGDMPTGYQGKELIDAFDFRVFSDILVLNYHTEATTKDVHKNGKGKYEEEIKGVMQANIDFIKKRFKEITGKELQLTSMGEPNMLFDYMNTHRSWLRAQWKFKIGNLKSISSEELTGEYHDDIRGITGQGLEESFDLGAWINSTREDRYKNLLDD